MELHRCRFVPYNPQAINALEFSHPASSKATGQGAQTLRLAVGRANGDIEIWNPLRGAWFQETIIRGGKGRCIEGLAWTLDPSEDAADGSGLRLPGRLRLFSIGYTNTVTEWDLEKGRPARHSSGSYGEIWCLTAQPRWTEKEKGGTAAAATGEYTGQHLAIGCADGSIVILSTADNDLKFVRRLQVSVTKNVRVLSIAFQNRNVIAAGYADSSIRLFDIRSGRLLRTVSLGRGPVGGPKDILVWSVKCLSDGTLVSGDSTGEIRFWDAKNYSLIQRLRGHQADVLDVAVGVDGETVISGGADRRTVLYRLKPGKKHDKSRRWAEVMHRRYHTHDVKKFAVYESKDISIAVSGGPDASLVVMPLRESGKEHHRTLSSLPQICQLTSSLSSRLMMSFWEREARIWRIAPENGDDADESQRNQLVGRVLIPGDENITSAALASNGTLLVLSTMTTVRMFALSWNDSEDEDVVLSINDLKVPPQIADDGARVVSLSPDLQWLSIVRPSSEVFLAKLSTDTTDNQTQVHSKLLRLERSSGKARTLRGVNMGTLGDYDRTIRTVTFSADSKLFATGDLAGFVDFWALEDVSSENQQQQAQPRTNGTNTSNDESDDDDDDDEDDDDNIAQTIDNQRWKSLAAMPCLHAGIVFMSFRPTSTSSSTTTDDRLLVLTSRHQVTEYEALRGKFSEWSQKNPKSHLPEEFIGLKDRAVGGVCGLFGSAQMPKLLLYGPSWLWMFDLTHDFPSPATTTTINNNNNNNNSHNTPAGSQKRKRLLNEEDEQERRKYNSGAGDLIPTSQAKVTLGTKMRKIVGSNKHDEVIVNAEKHRQHGSKDTNKKHGNEDQEDAAAAGDDDDDNNNNNNNNEEYDEDAYPNTNPFFVNGEPDFAHLRRSGIADDKESKNPADGVPDNHHDNNQTPIFWHSYRFRDILGVLPIGSGHRNSNINNVVGSNNSKRKESEAVVELAIVERPLWDMDLGERYVKDYE